MILGLGLGESGITIGSRLAEYESSTLVPVSLWVPDSCLVLRLYLALCWAEAEGCVVGGWVMVDGGELPRTRLDFCGDKLLLKAAVCVLQ